MYGASMSEGLSVLACASCGAPVEVTREKLTHCAHCGHDTEVPENYRAALDVAEREVETDALTQAAFAKLGAGPPWPLRAIGVISSKWWLVPLLFLFVFDVVVDIADYGFDHIEAWFGVNGWDWFTLNEQILIVWGSSIFVMAVLVVLGAFGMRRATDLTALHAALAAKPPDREGGPARCRECGAPLTIPKNALGVRCAYCKTDNLVAIPKIDLLRAKIATKKVAREVKQALGDQRSEIRKLRISLAVRLVLVTVLGAWILSSPIRDEATPQSGDGDLALRYALTHPQKLFDQKIIHTEFGDAPHPPTPRVPVDQCESWYDIDREDLFCDKDACYGGWFVALRKGETLTLMLKQRASSSLYAHDGGRGWFSVYGDFTNWGTEVAKANGDPQQPLVTKAPYTSWYRIQFAAADVKDKVAVCAKIDPPTK